LPETTIAHVRTAHAHDAERIAALTIQLGYEVPAGCVARRLEGRGGRREVFVAARSGRIVGWAAVSVDEPFVEGFGARLEGLVVDEDARSRTIGTQLLAAAEAWARERGCVEIRVQSNVLRERAHAFYGRNGYATIKAQYQLRKPLREPGAATIAVRRPELDADFVRLAALFVEYESELPAELRHGSVPPIRDLAEIYAGRSAAFIGQREGEAIGCVAVKELDDRTAVVQRLFVRPDGRGRGAARCLVTAAIRFAREAGYGRLVLDTNKERLMPAYLLYRSFGFEDCPQYAAVSYESPTFMELLLSGKT
jgi:GNAT superfamily N-acetyltransferase